MIFILSDLKEPSTHGLNYHDINLLLLSLTNPHYAKYLIMNGWDKASVLFQGLNREFTIRAVDTEKAMAFFQVDKDTGDVSVRRSLLTDPDKDTEYEVKTALTL